MVITGSFSRPASVRRALAFFPFHGLRFSFCSHACTYTQATAALFQQLLGMGVQCEGVVHTRTHAGTPQSNPRSSDSLHRVAKTDPVEGVRVRVGRFDVFALKGGYTDEESNDAWVAFARFTGTRGCSTQHVFDSELGLTWRYLDYFLGLNV